MMIYKMIVRVVFYSKKEFNTKKNIQREKIVSAKSFHSYLSKLPDAVTTTTTQTVSEFTLNGPIINEMVDDNEMALVQHHQVLQVPFYYVILS